MAIVKPIPTVPADLRAAGFIIPPVDPQNSLLVSSAALEKQGKTHFALTMPDPVGVVSIDLGTKGVADKFMKTGKKIYLREHMAIGDAKRELKDEKAKLNYWKEIKNSIYRVIDNKECRSGVVDTGTELWLACRLGMLGSLGKLKKRQFAYDEPNEEFTNLIRDMQLSGKNWCILHKMKKEYVDDEWSGGWERAGFGNMGFLAEVNIEHFRATPAQARAFTQAGAACNHHDFCTKVVDCRANGDLIDEVYPGVISTFQDLAMGVYPDSDPGDWE